MNQVKKLVLSVAVVISFVGYSFGLRHQDGPPVTHLQPAAPKTSPTDTPAISTSTAKTQLSTTASGYKNGNFIGSIADAFYGNIQVEVTIVSGKITNVQFLQYPNDRRQSVAINQQAMPLLKQEALQVQNAHVDGVTGATDTSQAFAESLAAALAKAS